MFTGCAMAVNPIINIGTSKVWVVANGADNDQVTVTIFNGTIPMNGSVVTYSVDNPDFGFFNPASANISQSAPVTTVNGSATVQFNTRTKSGNATIFANIRYKMNETAPEQTAVVSIVQRIDHDTPYKISSYSLRSEGTVGTVDPIYVWVQDAHNNPVDNKREVSEGGTPESVVFSITGQPESSQPAPALYNSGHFVPEGTSNVTRYVNDSGAVEANLMLATIPGTHNVMATAMFPTQISKKWTIDSQADGDPCYIDCQIFPYAEPNPYLPADDSSQFTLIYSLYDKYMNGLQAKTIDITTDLGQVFSFGTNATGQQVFSYGPSPVVAIVNLQATARDNLSVSRTDTIEFVNTTASNMVFTATPLSLPSADVPPAPPRVSTLTAHVLDVEGNPVMGETVQFTIPGSSIRYGGANYTAIYPPWLYNGTVTNVTTVTAISDSTGIATVYLMPCVFNSNKSDTNGHPPYVPSATGYCSVIATWTAADGTLITDQQDFEFKNYPYLSAKTSLSENEIQVNGTVDVTLYLSGDGFALLPTPIDVQLVCDKSGSMAENMAGTQNVNAPNRRWDAENASAYVFISKMNASTDRLGLTLFDTNPSAVTKHLGTSFSTIQTSIKTATPNGNTGTRKALKLAIDDMAAYPNSNSNAIRAIILMTDGEYNNYGDPLARGIGYDSGHTDSHGDYYTGTNWGDGQITEHYFFSGMPSPAGVVKGASGANVNTYQNMTRYAISKGLRVYTISLSNGIVVNGSIWNTLENLALCTGGKHYHATSAAQLTDVYTQIAGELKNKAGVNTQSNLSFENIEVKNVTVPGAAAFEYIPLNNVSTHVENWNSTGYHEYWINQSSIWDAFHTFSFNAGTIYIGDYWKVTFRLKALLDGDIHVFDPSSVITFNNDGAQTMPLPDTIIKVIPNATNESGGSGEFIETDINVTPLTNTSFEWQWNRQYTGNQQVSEDYFISFDGGQQWTLIGDKLLSPGDARNQTVGSFIWDVRNLLSPEEIAAGFTVDFKIKAFAQDAPSPRTPRSPPIIRNMLTNTQYITLQ
jgi:hypothetical protein